MASACPPVDRRERGVGRALIHEYKAPPVQIPANQSTPSSSQELVSLRRTHTPSFGLKPIFLSSLLSVDSLTETPTISLRKRHLSLRVMAGLSSTSASKSFLALSSSLGLEPGCFFGGEGPTLPASGRVAFDRSATYPEGPSSLAFWHPSVYSFEDLLSQVF